MNWPGWIDPETGKPLSQVENRLCNEDGPGYPVVDGIPRFVPRTNYADAFGEQWKRFRLTQLDSHTGFPISRDRLAHCFGETLWSEIRDKLVLEAGCGAGRFTEVLLEAGAQVASIDLSLAVDANVQNCPISPQHRIAQADIAKLPWPDHCFDVVMCLGVLQHTPNPEASIEALSRRVKPGGYLIIDHYAPALTRYTKLGVLTLRALIKRLPSHRRMQVTDRMVDLWFPFHKQVAPRTKWGQAVLSRLSPITTYFHVYPELDEEAQRAFAYLDTHDSLTDWFKHLRTTNQIRNELKRLGLEEIELWRTGVRVEGRARRP